MKKNKLTFEFHHRLTLIFAVIIAAILLGVYFYLNEGYEKDVYERIHRSLIKQVALTKSMVELNASSEWDVPQWDVIADRIGNDLGIRATIINDQGAVLGDSGLTAEEIGKVENHFQRAEVQGSLDAPYGESRRFSTTLKTHFLYLAMRFENEEIKGFIRLAKPLTEIDETTLRLKQVLVGSLFFAFAFSLFLSYLASHFFTKPVREISQAAKRIAQGDLSEKIPVMKKDVVKDLSDAINYMIEQLEHRISEVGLEKSRLEAVLLSMFEGVLVVDADRSIILMNQALQDLLLIEDDPIGKKTLEVIRNLNVQDIVSRTLTLHQGVYTSETTFMYPVETTLLIHATPVAREGNTEGVVLVFHNITELRKLEKMRKEFVANVSHELRTPIASIKGYAETLLDGALNDKKNAKDFLKIIHDDADRLARLIEDILDLSGIESGSFNLMIKPQALKPIADRVVSGLTKQIVEKKLEVCNKIPVDTPYVLADEDRLAQVLVNLVDNAVKYTHDHGKITIFSEDKGDMIEVSIQDTGIGIPSEVQPRIFERFFRVDKARSRDLGGTGLGLSIVKHIISSHKGEVYVKSQLGQGSTFSFTLPKA